jgi:mono/diheme cytochrome c family protein
MTMPKGADIMKGREVYLKRCFTCHGDAGQGEGPSSVVLRPTPANFTDPDVDEIPDFELFWKVTMGLSNSAMPQWGLLLSEQDRWNALLYVKKTFVAPSEPQDVSDELPVAYQALEPTVEDTTSARAAGKLAYEAFCSECHGPKGLGDGPYGPALMPTPANLAEDPASVSPAEWWYWRLDQGVVGFDGKTPHPTAMPAWRFILTDEQKWDIIFYARDLVGAKDGAQ